MLQLCRELMQFAAHSTKVLSCSRIQKMQVLPHLLLFKKYNMINSRKTFLFAPVVSEQSPNYSDTVPFTQSTITIQLSILSVHN
jgi:hypothetical protein